MTLVLGIDTSGDVCAAAVLRDGDVLAERRRVMTRGHAEALIPMVMDLFAETRLAAAACDVIGVAVGPGSFTGIRTGIAAARGLALACDAVAVGVSSLAAEAQAAFAAHPDSGRVACVLETRRSDFFFQAFVPGPTPLGAPEILPASDIAARLAPGDRLAGNAVERFRGEAGPVAIPVGGGPSEAATAASPADIARLAAAQHAAAADSGGENGLERTLSPLYLRPAEARKPADGGRLRR